MTASSLSFRRPWFPKKVKILGHGIDVDFFKPAAGVKKEGIFNIVTVGRISPTKDYESMIKALRELNNKNVRPVTPGGKDFTSEKKDYVSNGAVSGADISFRPVSNGVHLKIIGDVILESQRAYLEDLKKMVEVMKLDSQVEFVGWVANKNLAPHYQAADLFINLSGTGSLDKAVLEAMACGTPVLTGNDAFAEILPPELMVERNNYKKLAERIKWLQNKSKEYKNALSEKLRSIVVNNHNLNQLASKIIQQFHDQE